LGEEFSGSYPGDHGRSFQGIFAFSAALKKQEKAFCYSRERIFFV